MNRLFGVLAVVLFLVGLLVVLAVDNASRELVEGLLFGGLASLAASHVAW